ncbi:hypothetical protein EJB05_26956, partial [Eragrostis curvula]
MRPPLRPVPLPHPILWLLAPIFEIHPHQAQIYGFELGRYTEQSDKKVFSAILSCMINANLLLGTLLGHGKGNSRPVTTMVIGFPSSLRVAVRMSTPGQLPLSYSYFAKIQTNVISELYYRMLQLFWSGTLLRGDSHVAAENWKSRGFAASLKCHGLAIFCTGIGLKLYRVRSFLQEVHELRSGLDRS